MALRKYRDDDSNSPAGSMLSTISLIFLAGAIIMMFFVVLSGVTDHAPLNKTWFLKVDDSSSFSTRATEQWTYFQICGAGNKNCGSPVPALPVGYAWLGNNRAVPSSLTGSHGKGTTSSYYYYMWRFGWVFYLMALILAVFAFFLGFAAYLGRLGAGLSGLVTAVATFWMAIAVALMTTVFVKMRNHFNNNGFHASVGSYAFGFSWASLTLLALATILFCLGVAPGGESTGRKRPSYFRRRGANKNRISFGDNESQRRVKEEYS